MKRRKIKRFQQLSEHQKKKRTFSLSISHFGPNVENSVFFKENEQVLLFFFGLKEQKRNIYLKKNLRAQNETGFICKQFLFFLGKKLFSNLLLPQNFFCSAIRMMNPLFCFFQDVVFIFTRSFVCPRTRMMR